MTTVRQTLAVFVFAVASVALADIPQPYIWWKMDKIVDKVVDGRDVKVVLNSGTNTDERCNLTLGPGVTRKSVYGVDNAIVFDASKEVATESWGRSYTPALKSRTVSFWICRDANNDKFDTTVNTTHYAFSGLSRENVLIDNNNTTINTKLGAREGTKEEIAHSYFYTTANFTRDAWHHIVIVLEDTGRTNEEEGAYYGNPIYNLYSYQDGAPFKTVEGRVTERGLDVPGTFYFGNIGENGVRPVPGAFSDVRIWDCALTASDVAGLWAEEAETHAPRVIGFWRMEEIVTAADGKHYVPDSSGCGVPLEIGSDNVLMDDAGISGRALDFPDSKQCYGVCSDKAAPIRDFTLSLWMRPKTGMDKLKDSPVNNTNPNIFNFGGYFRCPFGELGDLMRNINVFGMASKTNSNAVGQYINAFEKKGYWNHFAFVAKAEKGEDGLWSVEPKVYCNGKFVSTRWRSSCPEFETNGQYAASMTFLLGNMGVGSNRAMWGQFDDVALIGAALTDEQIEKLAQGLPNVNAGADFSVVGETARLAGSLPLDQGGDYGRAARTDSAVWSLVSAPAGAAVRIAAPDDLTTEVALPVEGEYVFRLTATLVGVSACDEVTVTRVTELPGAAPTVVVSAPSAAVAGAVVPLSAVASEGARVFWSKVSGPGAVGFEPKEGTSVDAQLFAAGNYVLRATANDGVRTVSQDFAVSVTAGDSTDLAEGLIGYWPLGTSQKDEVSGQAFDSTHYNKAAMIRPGVDGYGTEVVGSDKYTLYSNVNLQEKALYPDETTDNKNTIPEDRWRSLSLWIKYDPQADTNNACGSVLAEVQYTLGLFYDKTNGIDRITMYQQTMCNAVKARTNYDYYNLDVTPFDNRWVHVYAAFDRQTIYTENASELWIDGVKQTVSDKGMGAGRINPNPLQFGNLNVSSGTAGANDRWDNRPRTFPGVLDEIRLYNRKLNESEIKMLAANPVVGANHAPAADVAAVPSGMTKGETAAVGAVAGDDGMPTGSTLTGQWVVLSGNAANLVFADPAARETTATALKAGTYTLAYRVSDGEKTTYSEPQTFEVGKTGLMLILR